MARFSNVEFVAESTSDAIDDIAGAYAAFSARERGRGRGGVHFKLERTLCQLCNVFE